MGRGFISLSGVQYIHKTANQTACTGGILCTFKRKKGQKVRERNIRYKLLIMQIDRWDREKNSYASRKEQVGAPKNTQHQNRERWNKSKTKQHRTEQQTASDTNHSQNNKSMQHPSPRRTRDATRKHIESNTDYNQKKSMQQPARIPNATNGTYMVSYLSPFGIFFW